MQSKPLMRKASKTRKTRKSGNFAVKTVRNHCDAYMCDSNPLSCGFP